MLELVEDLGIKPFGLNSKRYHVWLVMCPSCEKPFEAEMGNIKAGRTSKCNECRLATTSDENLRRVQVAADSFAEKAEKVHGNTYDYSAVVYETARKKVIVICRIHEGWGITPDNHLRGYGCPNCGAIRANSLKATNIATTFYYLRVKHFGTYLYKVGITTRGIEARYKQEDCDYEIIWEYSTTGIIADAIERYLIITYGEFLYIGRSPFKLTGTSEVFAEDISTMSAFKSMQTNLTP